MKVTPLTIETVKLFIFIFIWSCNILNLFLLCACLGFFWIALVSSGCVNSISVLVFMRLHFNRTHGAENFAGLLVMSTISRCFIPMGSSLLINHVLKHLSVLSVKIALALIISSVEQ